MHPKLDERIKLCQHSYDMPSWWICGQHDKELLIGAARHGVAKTDFNILRDKTLSFHIVLENSLRTLRGQPAPMNPYQGQPGFDPLTSTPNPKFDRGNLIVGTPTALLHDIRLSDFKKEDPEVSPVKPAQEDNASIKEKLKKVVKASMNETSPSDDGIAMKESVADEKNPDLVKEEENGEKTNEADTKEASTLKKNEEMSTPKKSEEAESTTVAKKSDESESTTVASDKNQEQTISNDEEKDIKGKEVLISSETEKLVVNSTDRNDCENRDEEVKTGESNFNKKEKDFDKISSEKDAKQKEEINKDCQELTEDKNIEHKEEHDDKFTTDEENNMQVDNVEEKVKKTGTLHPVKKEEEAKVVDNDNDKNEEKVETEDLSKEGQDPVLAEKECNSQAKDIDLKSDKTNEERETGETLEESKNKPATDLLEYNQTEASNCIKLSDEETVTEMTESEEKKKVKVEIECLETKDNNDPMDNAQSLNTEKDLIKTEPQVEKAPSSIKEESDLETKENTSVKSEISIAPKAENPPAVIEVGDDDEEDNKPDYVKLKEKIIKTEIERINEERLKREREAKLAAENGIPPYGTAGSKGMFIDDSMMEIEGLEPGEIAPTRYFGPAVEWPKDRVIFHRLEHICYTIEHGEWPFARRPPPQFLLPGGTPTHLADSRSQTPVGALKSEAANGADSDHSESLSSSDMMGQQIDNMKMTFQKRGPGRRRKYEIDPEKVNRIQQLLNQSAAGALSSDDSQSESVSAPGQSNSNGGGDRTGSIVSSTPGSSAMGSSMSSSAATFVGNSSRVGLPKSPLVTSTSPSSSALSHLPQALTKHLPSSLLNGNIGDMDHAQLQRHMLEQGMFIPERKRRGRKRRSEKMAEMAMAEALAKREQARILAMLDPDTRIPMINLEDGSVLTGRDCPRKRNMEAWLQQHPGYMIDNSICLLDPYLAEMRASLASRACRDDRESGSSRHSSDRGLPFGKEGGAGSHKFSSSSMPVPTTSLTAAGSPPLFSLRSREHGEREEEPNPQFVLNTPEIKPETFVRRRGRKPQLDPRTLDIDRLTGNENVAVVERGSGKKITGSKAPPLKHLRQWLDQNPSFDVEHKWGDLVKAKGVLPKSMDSRILRPSGRGRKPREPLHHSQLRHLNNEAQQQQQQQSSHSYPPASLASFSAFPGAAAAAAAMMGNFPKLPMGLPFAGLPGLPGMGNPLLGLQGLGIPGMGLPPHLVKAMEEELREREKEMKEQEKLREREHWGSEGSKEHQDERRRSNSGSQPEGTGEDARQAASRQGDGGKKDYSSSSSRQAAAAAAAAAAQAAALAAATSGMKGMSAEQAQQAFAPYLFNPMLYNPLLAAAASQGLQGIQGLGLPTTLAGMLPPGLVLPPHSATSPISSSQAGESEPSASLKSSSSSSSGSSSSKHHHRHHEPHQHHDKRRKLHRQEQRLSPPPSSSIPSTYHSSSSKATPSVSYAAEDLSVKVSKSHYPKRPSSASPLSPSSHVQDLSVKKLEDSNNQSSSQDYATDLTVKSKSMPISGDKSPERDGSQLSPSISSQSSLSSGKIPSSSLKVPHKNKIQGSLKLNKILDSLKDRVLKTDPVEKEKTSQQAEPASTNEDEESKKE